MSKREEMRPPFDQTVAQGTLADEAPVEIQDADLHDQTAFWAARSATRPMVK